jgi:TM2 domain-containing membrane protein YozV/DNA-directed RNA polymerase subunit RPC12/RpoP
MSYCSNCGNEVNEKAVACPKCGVPPRSEKKHCYNCGVTVSNPNQVVCTACGVSIAGSGSQTTGSRTKLAAGLLAILLGVWGAHKFYNGSWGWGIMYIVFLIVTLGFGALITGPLALIEGILYLTMDESKYSAKYNDTPDSSFKW